MDKKTIAVLGATGIQGGSVARVLLETGKWHVRGITRKPDGDPAKAIEELGVEVVKADLDDVDSLLKAFDGAHAVFGLTNFWEHLFSGLSAEEAGRRETEQGVNIAIAAAKTASLEQYIWSTVVPANKVTGGKISVPHADYKAGIDVRIQDEFPELAKKTTFVYVGFYPTNFIYYPQIKPIGVASGKYIWPQPVRSSTTLPMAGDMTVNPGIVVRQILAHPEKSKGRYASVWSETITMKELLKIWSRVTGKEGVFVQVSPESFAEMWGEPGGKELADMYEFCQFVTDWGVHRQGNLLTPEDLGIKKGELVGMERALEGLKAML